MPIIDCLNSVAVKRTARLIQLEGLFDVPPTERSECTYRVDLPVESIDWSIGLIVGPSGSGKTTLARAAFGQHLIKDYAWPEHEAIVEAFPATLPIKEITSLLSSVGFSSPPSWVRPFRCLSTGEQFRATLARALAESPKLAVIDEFTSVLDRTVAQFASAALAKAVRRSKRKIVAATCHEDVVDWLDPDWILEMPGGHFTRRSLRGRPTLELAIARVHRSAWELFRRHHYLDASLHRSAKCFVASYRDRPAAFASCLYQPSLRGGCWREHRTVCLPDFQGVGIGNALSEFIASLMIASGKPYRSTTGSPATIHHRCRSPNWRLIRKPGLNRRNRREASKGFELARSRAVARLTAGFEFIGPARPDEARRFAVA
jgi:ABC-type molybdenum transport system ATPase subunit/photorepair protein PhrA